MIWIILGFILIAIAGTCEAVVDTVNFHYYESIFKEKPFRQYFWNAHISWRNKYKNCDPRNGPRFLGSTTIFVFATDAWHLFKFFNKIALFTGLAILCYHASNILWLIIFVFGSRIIYGSVFTFCYNWLFLLKSK